MVFCYTHRSVSYLIIIKDILYFSRQKQIQRPTVKLYSQRWSLRHTILNVIFNKPLPSYFKKPHRRRGGKTMRARRMEDTRRTRSFDQLSQVHICSQRLKQKGLGLHQQVYVYYCVFFTLFYCEGAKNRQTLMVWAAKINNVYI